MTKPWLSGPLGSPVRSYLGWSSLIPLGMIKVHGQKFDPMVDCQSDNNIVALGKRAQQLL